MKRKSTILLSLLLTLTAVFSMPILSSCDDGVEISFATATAEEIEPITRKVGDLYGKLPVPTREGYTFLGWKTEKMGGEYARRSVKVEKDIDHTLYAKWRKDEEEITFPLEVKKERIDGAGIYGGTTFYIDENGGMYAWGKNDQGQVGDGTTETRLSPVAVMTDKKWAQVDGDDFGKMYGIDEDGGLWSWGTRKKNVADAYETTPPQLTPERIMPNKKFCAIEAGWGFYRHFALALDVNGGLWAWGDNYYGQLGQGGGSNPLKDSGDDTPVRIKKDTRFVEISTNGETCGAIDEEGKLWLWGDNLNGELGSGKIYDGDDLSTSMSWLSSSTPTVAIETEGVRFSKVKCSLVNTFAIDEEGNIWGCGGNDNSVIKNSASKHISKMTQITKEVRYVQLGLYPSMLVILDEYGMIWWCGWDGDSLLHCYSCLHDVEIAHTKDICEYFIESKPIEAEACYINNFNVNFFYYASDMFYVFCREKELWGWHSYVIKQGGRSYATKLEDSFIIGDGKRGLYSLEEPVLIIKERE